MAKVQYEGSEQFKPISAWGYVGYSLLFLIPIVGLILLIAFSFSTKNICRRNYARSYWCVFLVGVIVVAAFGALSYFRVGNASIMLRNTFPDLYRLIETWRESLSKSVQTTSNRTATTAPTNIPTLAPATKAASSKSSTVVTAKPASSAAQSSTSSSTVGVRKEVKDAIDSYEKFFKEYASFMKKYAASSNPLSMMSDYANMMSQYATTMEKFEHLQDQYELNNAELKYYTEANLRIQKLLLDAM